MHISLVIASIPLCLPLYLAVFSDPLTHFSVVNRISFYLYRFTLLYNLKDLDLDEREEVKDAAAHQVLPHAPGPQRKDPQTAGQKGRGIYIAFRSFQASPSHIQQKIFFRDHT